MWSNEFSRRRFLGQSLVGAGAAWLAAAWPDVLAARQHAQRAMSAAAAGAPPKFDYFTTQQAADVEAITSLILPTTDTPGAREAGVVYFLDHALHTYAADQQKPFLDALAALDAKRKELFPASADFVSLTASEQSQIIKAIEKTPAFGIVQFGAVAGFLCNPEDGGNRGMVGWKLIGFDHASTHTPPFGYYDAEYLKEKAAPRKGAKS